jgi:hypothetical protein
MSTAFFDPREQEWQALTPTEQTLLDTIDAKFEVPEPTSFEQFDAYLDRLAAAARLEDAVNPGIIVVQANERNQRAIQNALAAERNGAVVIWRRPDIEEDHDPRFARPQTLDGVLARQHRTRDEAAARYAGDTDVRAPR